MCGFCGFYLNSQNNIDDSKKILLDMNNAISHRGPDAEGHEFDEKENSSVLLILILIVVILIGGYFIYLRLKK